MTWLRGDPKSFETHIEETIKKNTKEAELGGRPGIAHKIQAFIRLTQKDLDSKGFNALVCPRLRDHQFD